MSFKHHGPSLRSPVASMADPQECVVARDINLPKTSHFFTASPGPLLYTGFRVSCYSCNRLVCKNNRVLSCPGYESLHSYLCLPIVHSLLGHRTYAWQKIPLDNTNNVMFDMKERSQTIHTSTYIEDVQILRLLTWEL